MAVGSNLSGKWIWLSHLWGPTSPTYGNGRKISISSKQRIDCGDSCNSISFDAPSNHIGTHVDLPRHFVGDGLDMNSYSASDFVFAYPLLIDVKLTGGKKHIGIAEIRDSLAMMDGLLSDCDALLVRTGAENYRHEDRFWQDGPGFDEGVADFVRSIMPDCRLIGIDAISITAFSARNLGRRVHREFLDRQKPYLIVEDMALNLAPAGYLGALIISPLRIENADGAPVTVFGRIDDRNG